MGSCPELITFILYMKCKPTKENKRVPFVVILVFMIYKAWNFVVWLS